MTTTANDQGGVPEISEAAWVKAHDLSYDDEHHLSVERKIKDAQSLYAVKAFARFIQEVSDAAKEAQQASIGHSARDIFAPFILPEPVDPLADACREVGVGRGLIEELREALASRGIEIGGSK